MTSYRSVLLALFAGWAVQAGPALAVEPDVSLICTAEQGRDFSVRIFLADRKMEVDDQTLPIEEIRPDVVIAQGYKSSELPGLSWAYWVHKWSVFRATLKFETHGIPTFNGGADSYITGQCRKASAQF